MKQARDLLMTILVVAVVIALVLVVFYESDLFESGSLAEEKNIEFLLTVIMELMTLGGVYLALRLFKFGRVHADLITMKEYALRKWGALRLLLLVVPMVANTLLYYMFMNTTFGYMAIIQLLCLPFVFPTMGRCLSEVESE